MSSYASGQRSNNDSQRETKADDPVRWSGNMRRMNCVLCPKVVKCFDAIMMREKMDLIVFKVQKL